MSAGIATNGLAYTDDGAGPCVVLVHGLTFNRASWSPIVAKVSDRLRCIAIDLPAHGDSSGPMSGWQLPPRLNELLEELEAGAPVIVGHSLGALVAVAYAAQFPTLGVIDVDQSLDVAAMGPMARAIAPALEGPGFEAAWGMVRQSIGRHLVPEPHRSELLAADEARPEVIRAYWADLIADADALQERVHGAAAHVRAPVLGVFGHQLGSAERSGFERAFPKAEVLIEEWPGTGHCAHLVDPDRFAQRLVGFADHCLADGKKAPNAAAGN